MVTHGSVRSGPVLIDWDRGWADDLALPIPCCVSSGPNSRT